MRLAKKYRTQSKQYTYDIKCEKCGEQLDYRKEKDKDGDTVIFVSPHHESGTDKE